MLLYKSIENKNNKENANITRALVFKNQQRVKGWRPKQVSLSGFVSERGPVMLIVKDSHRNS